MGDWVILYLTACSNHSLHKEIGLHQRHKFGVDIVFTMWFKYPFGGARGERAHPLTQVFGLGYCG